MASLLYLLLAGVTLAPAFIGDYMIGYPEYLFTSASITLLFTLFTYLLFLLDFRKANPASKKVYPSLIRHTLILSFGLYASAALTYLYAWIYFT